MTSRIVTDEAGRVALQLFIATHSLPFSVSIVKGKNRTWLQNKLQRKWVNEIAEQKPDQTAEEWRGYCKLTIGVPIMRAAHEGFCESYDRLIRPLPYETKLEYMMEPLDFPVTRLMTTKQKTDYLDQIVRHFSQQGVVLTDPNMRGMHNGS